MKKERPKEKVGGHRNCNVRVIKKDWTVSQFRGTEKQSVNKKNGSALLKQLAKVRKQIQFNTKFPLINRCDQGSWT